MHLEPDRLLVAHPRSLLRQLVDGATDHHRDQLVPRGARHRFRTDPAAIPQHADGAGYRLKLLDAVRDVDDRNAVRGETAVTPKRRCTSASATAEVGSSMMRTRASIESALAASTSCCSATRHCRTGRRVGMSRPTPWRNSAAPAFVRRTLDPSVPGPARCCQRRSYRAPG